MQPFERTELLANKLDLDNLAGNQISHEDALELVHAFKADLRDFKADTQPAPLKKISHVVDAIHNTTDRVQSHMDKVRQDKDTTGLLVAFHHLSASYKDLDDARKSMYHVKDKYDKLFIPGLFDNLGQDSIRIPQVARSFYPLTKWSAKVVNKQALHEWLPEVGLGSLITQTVNSSELAAALKERLLTTGEDPPEEIVELKSYKITGMSRYNPKKS